jgi:hypothetical protein
MLLRLREQQAHVKHQVDSVMNIQRVYRGHICRAHDVRAREFANMEQAQRHALDIHIKYRQYLRYRRKAGATLLQSLYRGHMVRRQQKAAAAAATKIQSIFRRCLAQKHVRDMREGNLHQFPVEAMTLPSLYDVMIVDVIECDILIVERVWLSVLG